MEGIIPTRVGTSVSKWWDKFLGEDHPHACGDKVNLSPFGVSARGSSPRVWGQATHFSVSGVSLGIIPTRVGTRISKPAMIHTLKDHPHACGDKHQK